MKTVKIIESFEAYPVAGKEEQRFLKGDEVEVSEAFADLILKKKLARIVPPAASAPTTAEPVIPAPAKDVSDGRGSRAVVISTPKKDVSE